VTSVNLVDKVTENEMEEVVVSSNKTAEANITEGPVVTQVVPIEDLTTEGAEMVTTKAEVIVDDTTTKAEEVVVEVTTESQEVVEVTPTGAPAESDNAYTASSIIFSFAISFPGAFCQTATQVSAIQSSVDTWSVLDDTCISDGSCTMQSVSCNDNAGTSFTLTLVIKEAFSDNMGLSTLKSTLTGTLPTITVELGRRRAVQSFTADSVAVTKEADCDAGAISTGASTCYWCDAGCYEVENTCIDCPINTYQPAVGQTSCLSCPLNTTTNSTGASDAEQCKAKDIETIIEEIVDGLSTGAIIGIAVGAGIVVTLLVVLIIVMMTKKNKVQEAPQPRMINPTGGVTNGGYNNSRQSMGP